MKLDPNKPKIIVNGKQVDKAGKKIKLYDKVSKRDIQKMIQDRLENIRKEKVK